MKKLPLFMIAVVIFAVPALAWSFEWDMTTGGIPLVLNGEGNDQPDVAVDSAGNIHMVWVEGLMEEFQPMQVSAPEIFYKMFSPNGDTLIPDWQVTSDDGFSSVRPTIAVNSAGDVFIVWQDTRYGDWAKVYICRLTPDPDGGTVTKTIGDTMISPNWSSVPRIAIDTTDNIHVVWQESLEEEREDWGETDFIMYARFTVNNGSFQSAPDMPRPLNPPGGIFNCGDDWVKRALPDLAIDSLGRIHVAWNECAWEMEIPVNEIYYTLLNPDGSDYFPDPGYFRMTDADGCTSNRQSITVDDQGNAYIVWQDKRDHVTWENEGASLDNCGTTEVYFMQIDPDANPAAPTKTINDKRLTELGDPEDVQPFSRMDMYGNIHVTWYKTLDLDGIKSDLFHMVVDQQGNVVPGSEHQISDSATSLKDWTNAHMAFPCVSPFIVWTDDSLVIPTVFGYWNPFVNDSDGTCTGEITPEGICLGIWSGDFIEDACDNCPDDANPDQADTDGDGTGDACDNCPDDPNKTEPGICGCGIADTDSDADGTPDCVDNCPGTDNPDQADTDGDGEGDACDACTDTDGDGFGNPGFDNECEEDLCPDIYNEENEYPEGDTNADCVVNKADMDHLLTSLGTSIENCPLCDINGDGAITCLDAIALVKIEPILARDIRVRSIILRCGTNTRRTR